MRDPPIALAGIIVLILVLANLDGCSGCDSSGDRAVTYRHGQDSGRLAEENTRLQEAAAQAAARLAVERQRSAHLETEVGVRRHVEALMVGVVVLTGCALAVTFYALARRRRSPP